MAEPRWKGNPGAWRTPARDPFEGVRFRPNPVPTGTGSVFPQGVLLEPKPTLGQALGTPVADPTIRRPPPTRPSAARAGLRSAAGVGGYQPMAAGGMGATPPPVAAQPVAGATGGAAARPTLGGALGSRSVLLTGGGGRFGGLGTAARRGGATVLWQAGMGGLAEAAGNGALGGGLQGANIGGQAAILAGRNPLTSPVTAGVGLADAAANTGLGNQLINAIRPDSWGDLPKGYGVGETLGVIGDNLFGGSNLLEEAMAKMTPEQLEEAMAKMTPEQRAAAGADPAAQPTVDRFAQFAESQNIPPEIVTQTKASIDETLALYDIYPKMFADMEGNIPERDAVVAQAEMDAVTGMLTMRDQQAAQEEQFAQQMALQSMISNSMQPYTQQIGQTGDMMAAAWNDYAQSAPEWMRPYAQQQAAQSRNNSSRLAAAYQAQAHALPGMAALNSSAAIDRQMQQQQLAQMMNPPQQGDDFAAILAAAAGG